MLQWSNGYPAQIQVTKEGGETQTLTFAENFWPSFTFSNRATDSNGNTTGQVQFLDAAGNTIVYLTKILNGTTETGGQFEIAPASSVNTVLRGSFSAPSGSIPMGFYPGGIGDPAAVWVTIAVIVCIILIILATCAYLNRLAQESCLEHAPSACKGKEVQSARFIGTCGRGECLVECK